MSKYLFLLLFLLPITGVAQFKVNGKVITSNEKTPIANASVFLNNTLVNNRTNTDGTFILKDVKPGQYDIVVSLSGYESYSKTILIKKDTSLADITLAPKTIQIKTVNIKLTRDRKRERYMKIFIEQFLGNSKNAAQCKILNPEVIDFDNDDKKDILHASTDDYMVIENHALGYRIQYKLTKFAYGVNLLYNIGQSAFEELKGTPEQQTTWTRNRELAYRGSSMHFLRSVIINDLQKQGFRVETFDDQQRKNVTLSPEEFFSQTEKPGLYAIRKSNLSSIDTYFVTYMKRKLSTIYRDRSSPIFDLNGNASSLAFTGDWATQAMAELLPFDYTPAKDLVL